jgi:hypothetical protein
MDELLLRSKDSGLRIRAIWAPDTVNQGASGIRNEVKLGDRCAVKLLCPCLRQTEMATDLSLKIAGTILPATCSRSSRPCVSRNPL